MLSRNQILLCIIAAIVLIGCDDGHLRGNVAPSKDGQTYLVVADDNGGGCGPILLDGKLWPYKTGEKGLVAPGAHKIECGGSINFDIPHGVVYTFDYWGP